MNRHKGFALAAFALAVCFTSGRTSAQPALPNVDSVIARHISARGGAQALGAITSLLYDRGAYSEDGKVLDTTAVMMLKRPYFKLVGHPERRPDFLEGYDGAAWEWYEDPGITLRTTGAASEATRHFADVEGPFVAYRKKGHRVRLIGRARVADRVAYQLRLTMPDGYTTDFFLDTATALIIASRHTAKVHAYGQPVTSETRFDDYRAVAGVLFPFRSREVDVVSGRELNAMQWGSIEANRNLPDVWFSPPTYTRSALQTFMDQLFVQRTSASAVLWTYRVFRQAHPGVDTREAAETIGFQILKDGQTATAIALLQQNAADHPGSASSAFGVGRALAAAGRVGEARRALSRALALDPSHARARSALAGLPRR